MRRVVRIAGSGLFVAGLALSILAEARTEGLISHVRADGTPAYYHESTGSIAGQDEYLLFVYLMLPVALLRLVFAPWRPTLVEVGLFLVTGFFIFIGWTSIGTDVLIETYEATGDIWVALWAMGLLVAAGSYVLVVVEGWALGRPGS